MNSLPSEYPDSSNVLSLFPSINYDLPEPTNEEIQAELDQHLNAALSKIREALHLVRLQAEQEIIKLARIKLYSQPSIQEKKNGRSYIQQKVFEICSSRYSYKSTTIIKLSNGKQAGCRVSTMTYTGNFEQASKRYQNSIQNLEKWRLLKKRIDGIDERLKNVAKQSVEAIRELNEAL